MNSPQQCSKDTLCRGYWGAAIIFGAISSAAIASTYIHTPVDVVDAGGAFAYNILFYFPVVGLSFLCGISEIIFLVSLIALKPHWRKWITAMPAILLFPFVWEAGLIVASFIRLPH
jgi:hypothetical protein